MDVILLFILAFSGIISLGSTACSSRRCFKVYEISIPRRRIHFHLCGNQIPPAVTRLCSNPRPTTKQPKTTGAKLKPTTTSTMASPSVNTSSVNTTSVNTTSVNTTSVNTTSVNMTSVGGPTTNLSRSNNQKGNHSQANYDGTQSHNTSRVVYGNRTDTNSGVISYDATSVTGSSLRKPPLLTTIDAKDYHGNKGLDLSHQEANSFLTSHAYSPGFNIVEECCIEGCVAEEVYEYC